MRTTSPNTFVVTEGHLDTQILKQVLLSSPESGFIFGVTSSVNHAITVAGSVLNTRDENVLLVLDAEPH